MQTKIRMMISGMLFIFGFAALILFQVYAPEWKTRDAVRMLRFVPEYESIGNADVEIIRVPAKWLPKNYIANPQEIVGKRANVDLTERTIPASPMIDIEELAPKPGEVIFPIPHTAIYSTNASLRAGDKVDVFLFRSDRKGSGDFSQLSGDAFITNVKVVAARGNAGNMVRDTKEGNTNDRLTATDSISHVELLLSETAAANLKQQIESGNLVWLVRTP
jgi:hypothetical protein